MRFIRFAVLLAFTACSPGGRADEGQPGSNTLPPGAASPGADSAGAPLRGTEACGPHSIITGAGLGGLRVGATVAEVDHTCKVADDYVGPGAEGSTERYLVVDFDTAQVRAIVVADRVWRVQVTSDAFRTADSLGVGTPLARLLRVPGLTGAEGEGRLFVMSDEHCGLSFRLSHIPRGGEHWGAWDLAALRMLPAETTVDEVLVFGCGDTGQTALVGGYNGPVRPT